MAKCHKNNSRKRLKKREQYVNDFFTREQRLNKMINHFIHKIKSLHYPFLINEYKEMDAARLEIKRLLDIQSKELWKQSYRRKRFYHEQLSKFKYYYVKWKRMTYYIYLHLRFNMPLHLTRALSFYKHYTHDIQNTIYTM